MRSELTPLVWALDAAAAPIAAFVRDPDRSVDRGSLPHVDAIVAPADGKVMHVGEPQPGVAPGAAARNSTADG